MHAQRGFGGVQVRDMVAALRAAGADAEGLCRSVGLDIASYSDGGRVPTAVVLALLAQAERGTGDANIGLHAGERAEPSGPLAYLIMSSPTLEEGIDQAARFAGLLISTLRFEIVRRADTLAVVYELGDETLALNRHVIGYLLMANLRSLQRSTNGDLTPREIHVRYRDPGNGAEQEAFGCPVHFARDATRLVFRRADLGVESRMANPTVAAELEKFVTALFSRSAATTVGARVAAASRALLAGGASIDRAAIARRLAMSDRTLRRALTRERATFKDIRESVLREVAEALLSNPALKIEAVALSTGFGDVAAFCKAFKRWTGVSPTQHRERAATAASS